jgi:hypothetical protein
MKYSFYVRYKGISQSRYELSQLDGHRFNKFVGLLIVPFQATKRTDEFSGTNRRVGGISMFLAVFRDGPNQLPLGSIVNLRFVIVVVVIRDFIGITRVLPRSVMRSDVIVPVVRYQDSCMQTCTVITERYSQVAAVLERVSAFRAPDRFFFVVALIADEFVFHLVHSRGSDRCVANDALSYFVRRTCRTNSSVVPQHMIAIATGPIFTALVA